MNNLNVYCLSEIFENLEIKDIVTSSEVCKKWKEASEMSKPKYLFIVYGTNYTKKNFLCHPDPYMPDLTKNLIPRYVLDNSIFETSCIDFLQNVETLIYYGNELLDVPKSFSLHLLPKLKYVEIMDKNFCETIQNNFQLCLENKKSRTKILYEHFCPSVETLNIEHINFHLLVSGFPNLKYVRVDQLEMGFEFFELLLNRKITKWKSFYVFNPFFLINIQNSNSGLIEFLMNNCPDLEAVAISVYDVNELDVLLSNSKLKTVCANICGEKYLSGFLRYESIISKHEARIKNDCSLCIDNKPIKCLNDFKSLANFYEFKEPLSIGENYCFVSRDLFLKITGPFDLKVLKNSDVTKHILHVSIKLKKQDEVFIKNLFKVLPKKLNKLDLKLKFLVSENTFDLLPQNFPYLQQLSLIIKKNELKKLNFVSQLKLLNAINLNFININWDGLIDAFDKLNFLTFIHTTVEQNCGINVIPSLKSVFKKKKLTSMFHLKLFFKSHCISFNSKTISQ